MRYTREALKGWFVQNAFLQERVTVVAWERKSQNKTLRLQDYMIASLQPVHD